MEMVNKLTNGDASKMALAGELYNECNSVESGDPCEAASKIGYCVKTKGQEKKLMFGL